MTIVDKANGNILYKPYLPLSLIYTSNNEVYGRMYIMENGVSKERYDEFAEWKNELNSEDLKYYNFICQYRQICLFDFYEELKIKWRRTKDWRSLASDQFLVLKKATFSNVDYNEWNWWGGNGMTEENYEELHDAFERWSDAEYERENELLSLEDYAEKSGEVWVIEEPETYYRYRNETKTYNEWEELFN